MSYILAFWKQDPPPLEPQAIYERLNGGEHVDQVEELPGNRLLQRLQEVFAGSEVSPPSSNAPFHTFDWEGPSGALQGCLTAQSFIVSAHGFPEEDMNRLIDVLREFDAPLYDPQVGERFDGADYE